MELLKYIKEQEESWIYIALDYMIENNYLKAKTFLVNYPRAIELIPYGILSYIYKAAELQEIAGDNFEKIDIRDYPILDPQSPVMPIAYEVGEGIIYRDYGNRMACSYNGLTGVDITDGTT